MIFIFKDIVQAMAAMALMLVPPWDASTSLEKAAWMCVYLFSWAYDECKTNIQTIRSEQVLE